MPGRFGVSREEKKRERNRERGLPRLDTAFPLLGDRLVSPPRHLFDFLPSVSPQRSIILQQVVSKPGSGSSAPASDSDPASELAIDLQKENESHGENLFVRGRIDWREPPNYRFKRHSKSREENKPNYSIPLQPNDVNGPQSWSRFFLTRSRDARARVSREEKKRERNRERGLLVTSITAAISEGIIPDHPLTYLQRLNVALPPLGDLLRSIILQQNPRPREGLNKIFSSKFKQPKVL
ncbi:hypothetical protein M9H77_23435 [Catharanthus roseus]|uniref:Uncharacterized protein n=1 Tax=Catharanthus roseus TaxID=4058 RepID=A0ACC0AVT3_CATRO|nr:hypothetical protein M9H77_23435 [Catharanthus roseus]